MFKQPLTTAMAGAFLFLGLVSCTEKSSSPDAWQDAPRIVMARPTGKDILALNFGDKVRLDDRLMLVPASFRDSVPTSPYVQMPGDVVAVTAVSNCQIGDKHFGSEHALSMRTEWSVAELLPLEFWKPAHTESGKEIVAHCELQVRLTNTNGSTRLRHVNKAEVSGVIPSDPNWVRSLDSILPPVLDYHKSDLFKVPTSLGAVVLSCSSFADQVIGSYETNLKERLSANPSGGQAPLQSCRMLEIGHTGIITASQVFKVKYPSRDLQTELFVRLNQTDGNLLYGVEKGLQYKVTNPEPYMVQFRVRKKSYFYVSFFGLIAEWSSMFARSNNHFAFTYLKNLGGPIAFETDEHVYFNLQPYQSIEFDYYFVLTHRTGCGQREVFGGFDFLIPSPDVIAPIQRANYPVTLDTVPVFESSHDANPVAKNAKKTAAGRLPYFVRWDGATAFSQAEKLEDVATVGDLKCWTFE